MSDYRITLKVSNARIRNAMRNAGFKTVAALCRASGADQVRVGQIINLKRLPMNQDGSYCKAAVDIADALGVMPEELFCDSQRTLRVTTNEGKVEMPESEFRKLACEPMELIGQDVVAEVESQQTTELVLAAVETLPERLRQVVKWRYLDEKTHEQCGKALDVTRERSRQLEQEALRKLRECSDLQEAH